jgi:hypothetical protein
MENGALVVSSDMLVFVGLKRRMTEEKNVLREECCHSFFEQTHYLVHHLSYMMRSQRDSAMSNTLSLPTLILRVTLTLTIQGWMDD